MWHDKCNLLWSRSDLDIYSSINIQWLLLMPTLYGRTSSMWPMIETFLEHPVSIYEIKTPITFPKTTSEYTVNGVSGKNWILPIDGQLFISWCFVKFQLFFISSPNLWLSGQVIIISAKVADFFTYRGHWIVEWATLDHAMSDHRQFVYVCHWSDEIYALGFSKKSTNRQPKIDWGRVSSLSGNFDNQQLTINGLL